MKDMMNDMMKDMMKDIKSHVCQWDDALELLAIVYDSGLQDLSSST